MRIEQVMTKDVRSCHAADTLNDAARVLWDQDCGCVPVVDDNGSVIGMLTDRDICMAAYTRGARLAEIPIADVMSKQVISCGPNDYVDAAEALMKKHQIRRLPVVGFENQLLGMLSLNDIARTARKGGNGHDRGLTAAVVEETLATIGEPRIHHAATA